MVYDGLHHIFLYRKETISLWINVLRSDNVNLSNNITITGYACSDQGNRTILVQHVSQSMDIYSLYVMIIYHGSKSYMDWILVIDIDKL